MKRAGSQSSKLLISLIVLLIAHTTFLLNTANAATAGSGACQQTYTVSGTGELAVYESGGYCYIAFKNTGVVNTQAIFSWTRPASALNVDVLVVGGGGGGGARHGGGGGAGSFVQTNAYTISASSSIAIAVGAGGGASTSFAGTSGQNSYFKPTTGSTSGLIAIGGGYGANGTAGPGGSGGGAGAGQTVGQVTAQTQSTFAGVTLSGISFGSAGKPGATEPNDPGDNNDYWAGGGGGGAAGQGTSPLSNGVETTAFLTNTSSTARGGSGGDGKSVSWLTPTVASNLSVGHTSLGAVYFAGGGGGGMGVDGLSGGAGGLGGGATGTRTDASGNAGTAFTGGGGGGSGFDDISKAGSTQTVSAAVAGAGGSGVVVIRYLWDTTAPTITGPSSATGATSSISIPETATAVFTFAANETVTWSKSGTDGTFFTITAGGVLSITTRNFESAEDSDGNNTYIVVITATDAANNITNQTLTVSITNVNEAPTISTNASAPTYAVSQAENISAVITFSATDVDSGTSLSWSIGGTDAAAFSIVSGTGVLSFLSPPDFEGQIDSDLNNEYVVIVTVSDGALTDTQTLTVTITNANETSTVGAPTFSAATIKGITLIISITTNASGRARFFVNGKRIPACLARPTTGTYPNFTATCSWKPPVTGRQNVSATFTPTDSSFSATNSPTTATWVSKRSTTR